MKSVLINMFSLVIICGLIGCGRSAPTNYYLLENARQPVLADNLPKRTLRVAQVETPAYLNRNNIVSRVTGQTKLILAEFHLWAEPVSNGVRRIVSETLFKPLLESGINVLPSDSDNNGDYALVIDVQRLDGNFNAPAVLDCRWTLLDSDDRPLKRGVFAAEEQVNGADYNLLVSAESELVRKFGRHLAQILPPLLKK